MGASLNGIVQHNLSPRELVSLKELPIDSIFEGINASPLEWVASNIDATFLIDYWNKTQEYFINNSWSEEDLAILQNNEISIHFWTPQLLTITPYFRPSSYKSDEPSRLKFNNIVSNIAKIVSAVDIIIIESWYVYEAFEEHNDLTVSEIKKGVIAKNLPFFEIDF